MKNESCFAAWRPLMATTLTALAVLSGGCTNMQQWRSAGDAGVAVPADAPSAIDRPARAVRDEGDGAKRKLAEGIERYEAGDYVGAIRALNAAEIVHAGAATRIEAEKYLAFSYCLTERRTLCREAFDRLLAMDSGFRLQPAEAGHPLWGPVYVQARKAAGERPN